MSSKGQSHQYGNTSGSNNVNHSNHIAFKYAKDFCKNGKKEHFDRHGKEFSCSTENEYVAKAIKFSNYIDRKNCVSFVQKGTHTTFKFNKKTNVLSIVNKNGYIASFHHIKGIKEYHRIKEEEINGKKRY